MMKTKLFHILALAVWAGAIPAGAQGKTQPDSLEIPAPFVTNVTELLKGRTAGVEVISSVAESGMIPTVHIRGVGATPSSQPLYVVDGVRVYSLEGISPDDIESVEALRDAAALTLYGPEAADGVIVVKTRRAGRKGFHASYDMQGLFQWPAWYPEGVTVDEFNAYEEKMGWSPFIDKECMTVADGTERSFSHKHHLALQWGGDRLKAYTGLSYLDQDGPLLGGEGYRRHTGSWSLSWTPAPWITVETTGNYGRSDKATEDSYLHIWNNMLRSCLVSRSSEPNVQAPGRSYSTFLTGSAGVEIRPLPGLLLRAGGGYSQNGTESAHLSWYESERVYSFYGQNDARDKWHWETEADYTAKFGDGHSLHAGLTYRQRTEDYDLFSVSGQSPISEAGVETGDVPAFLREFLLPEMERLRSSGLTEQGHLSSASPYVWTSKWSEMSARAGYAWKDIARVEGSLFRAAAPAGDGKEPRVGWSVNGQWNLMPMFREHLPAWWRNWTLHGSWGQISRIMKTYDRNTFLLSTSGLVTIDSPPHKEDETRSIRREAGMDFGFGEDGGFKLSATRFWNDDEACMYFPTSFGSYYRPFYTVLNRGWEFTGSRQGARGDFHYAVAGNLTLYSNRIKMAEEDASFEWNGKALAHDGDPVGVGRLFPFSWDNYTAENPNYYLMPSGEKFSYEGGSMPTVSLGLRATAGWKQWSLTVSGHGMGGNSILANNVDSALWRYYLDKYPDGGYYLTSTTAALFKGSFFRIDQIRLDYAFRSSLRFYASLDNWFLFTHYPGSDPEMALHSKGFGLETGSFPTSKRVLFGLSVGF